MRNLLLTGVLVLTGLLWAGSQTVAMETPQNQPQRETLQKLFQAGNYKDAYEGFRKRALDPNNDPRKVGDDLRVAVQCLQQLGRVNEIDPLMEGVIGVHQNNWRLLWTAAQVYLEIPHHGFMIAGQFQRGDHRGGGQVVNAAERDRVRALQLMNQARPLATSDDDHGAVGGYLLAFARMLLRGRGQEEAWRLQSLTDLGQLPDYEEGWGYYQPSRGAPVDAEGNPVFHYVPKSFEEAKTDGQRWRWCLEQAVEMNPHQANEVRIEFANFLWNQFGVQTMAHYGWFFGRAATDDTQKHESGAYALHTLGEDETIARLASGIKRFKLPDEFNFIKIYQEIAAKQSDGWKLNALEHLAQLFENRRQYPKAAEYWRQCIALANQQHHKDRLAQIVGNWGEFEPIMTQPAGRGATVEYRFRNGPRVEFTAKEVLIDKLLGDVKTYLKSRPGQLDWKKLEIGNIGYRLLQENQEQYLGREVARWDLQLEPRPNHFDRRVTVTTPLQKAGAYFVTAKMADGNTSHIVLWLADTVIAKKPLDQKHFYYVADAVTGKPIPKANVEFFGWRQEHRQGRHFELFLQQFAEFTDANGQVITDEATQPPNYQWVIIARTKEGRLAYLGFTGVWYGRRYDAEYNQTKVYTITDRPVYRPSQNVHYKFWIRHAKYDQEDTSDFAGKSFTVEIYNPKNERIERKQVTADPYGGIEGELALPADATLGVYRLVVEGRGGGSFRVEEYKKPEFEVSVDAPSEPVMLGEKITATIKAKYYFGSPVTKARVKYKVERSQFSDRWYPIGPWDWLYGSGYWWFAYDYDWYPGWRHWGWCRPMPFWWPRPHTPPELVADQEVEIGPDGTVKVEIDTSVAKAIHPDQDHRYTITAEVVDQSRRTIVGAGSVLVARKPFQVTTWVNCGYYRTGDVLQAHAAARTLDGKPVQGEGQLTLFQIRYQDAKPVEKEVFSRPLSINEEGRGQMRIKVNQPGQYRVSTKVTDRQGHAIEGGYVFTVIGQKLDDTAARFNPLELLPDKADYQPGETVKLLVNTDQADSTVLLFVRPANGVYLPPKMIQLDGKSTVEEIAVVKRDMPNFFVEAVTIAGGRVYTETKEIVVPPEKRVLTVDIEPSKEAYKPGEKAAVKLKLTDFDGKPFVGSTVVAIYDKSVEYISVGSNVPEIKQFFWKWRRHHHPQTESSLQRASQNLVPSGAKRMNDLGVFGRSVAEEIDGLEANGMVKSRLSGQRQLGMTFDRDMGAIGGMGMPAPTAAPMMKMESASRMMGADAAKPAEAMAELSDMKADEAGGAAPLVEATVRKEFADTALWAGALTTAHDGTAEVQLDMPENLTTWRIKVWGMGHGTRVGEGATDVVTRKDLILRMQAPRFFVQTDEVVLSANVHNYLKTKKAVQVALELDGRVLQPLGALVQSVEVAPNDETRIDWRVKVLDEGEATVRMKALTDEESDAMEQKFPCYVHGMLKMDSYSGSIRPDGEQGKFTVTVPAERRPEQTRLEVRYSPTLAGAMVDALPYLVDYPYGCTEQTLNRFLPTVITQKVLLEMGLNLEEIRKKQTNLNAQELGDAQQRAAQWKRYKRNPVFDEAEVQRMVKEGVQRLTEMQLSDGGWGWFSGFGERSTPHTTAVVVHGLQIAVQNDVALVPGVLDRGVEWLKRYQAEQIQWLKNAQQDPKKDPYKLYADNLDALVYMVLVDAGADNAEMQEFLYRDRTKLAVYGLTMFGVALEKLDQKDKLAMILQNIGQYVVEDDENQTAYLKLPNESYWWCWYGSEYEAHAYYLKLLAKTDPKGERARRLVKYLLNNRKHATYWNSTRDTALVVEAMADFLRASGETKPEMTVEIWLDGKLQKAVEITAANLFQFDNAFVVEGEALAAGPHQVELKKKGQGPLYYNGYLTNFTLEDFITKAGLEIKVQRKYYRLTKADKSIQAVGSHGQVVDQKVEKYVREELPNLATLKSGELVEIELEIDSKNDYEYLVFEDMKPAGFEPVDVRSGYTGNALGAYVEFRDNRVVFFARVLARGKHSVAYRMRAEIPGKFSALPTRASAMYAPELKANSDEIKLRVEDK
jgi:uncharacterized protein YfaS (alpha-2-macroglobulin family)